MSAIAISKGQRIVAKGGLWTVTGCGNGRYSLRCEASKRTYTMAHAQLHADLDTGKAFVANEAAYAKPVVAGVAYGNAMRAFQRAISGGES